MLGVFTVLGLLPRGGRRATGGGAGREAEGAQASGLLCGGCEPPAQHACPHAARAPGGHCMFLPHVTRVLLSCDTRVFPRDTLPLTCFRPHAT